MRVRSPILPAGFKARGARIRDEDAPLQPGEFRDIDVVGGTLQGSLMPLPFKEPSGTLYNLLGTLVDAGRRFASMADLKVGEMGGDTPVGTTMAIMERGTKVMSAIHKRLHYSQKIEFKLLARIFSETIQTYPYQADMQMGPEVFVQDFDARVTFCLYLIQTSSLCLSVLLWHKQSCSWFSLIHRFMVGRRDCISVSQDV
jgi:hypothetical protein